MPNNKKWMDAQSLYEIAEVAVIAHPDTGVLLIHTERRDWHFPDCTLTVGEAWDDSLLEAVAETTGLTDTRIESVLAIQNFGPGEVAERPQYGVFFLCQAGTLDVDLDDGIDDFAWVNTVTWLDDLDLFHPRIKEFVGSALSQPLSMES